MARYKRRRQRKNNHTLGIPGLPKVRMLGCIPSERPMYLGKRYSKLIKDEPSPSWDDGVREIEK